MPRRTYDNVISEHIAEIRRRFGQKRAEMANIGWGDNGAELCSKIYPTNAKEQLEFVTTFYDDKFRVTGHTTHRRG